MQQVLLVCSMVGTVEGGRDRGKGQTEGVEGGGREGEEGKGGKDKQGRGNRSDKVEERRRVGEDSEDMMQCLSYCVSTSRGLIISE